MKFQKCKARRCTQGNSMGEFCIYHYEESRGREVYPVSASHALKLGLKASQASAENGWTAHEMELVDKAIKRIAMTKFTFTADDVWQVLGFQFPVTKGMAARLSKAARDGIIVNTGTIGYAKRGGEHDHNQRLTIWQSTLVMAG